MPVNPLLERYRLSDETGHFESQEVTGAPGYFRIGENAIAYGRTRGGRSSATVNCGLEDMLALAERSQAGYVLPFDPGEVVENLRNERYLGSVPDSRLRNWGKSWYYRLRPAIPSPARHVLKRFVHRGWRKQAFPVWPVDHSVEDIAERMLALLLHDQPDKAVPFIWFWPKHYSGCVIMTHDVETEIGLSYCRDLMSLNESNGVKASFQLVPAERYSTSLDLIQEIRQRGHEVNIHDWNHDGRLFSDRSTFLNRVTKINEAARQYGAEGFRSGALYRNLDWYNEFSLSYDMSVPNVGHLDPQPGGCCTVMPYFVGKILELPVTTTQDYMLFHLLGHYSLDLWKQQLDLIFAKHGLASFIVHPDYIVEPKAQQTYRKLLEHLRELQSARNIWLALPGEANQWWRKRSQMNLVRKADGWTIEGPGCDDARIAWASLDNFQLTYSFADN